MERNTKNYSLLIILLLLSIAGYAQKGVHGLGTSPIDTGVVARNFRVDSNVQFRKYATSDTNKVAGFDANGNIVLRTKSTGGGSGTTDSSIFATKYWVGSQGYLQASDTSRSGIVTTYWYVDSLNALNVKYSDTANMLANYLRKIDTTSLSNRIDARVKYTDTSGMLAPYLRSSDAAAIYVPYTGATGNVNLGTHELTTDAVQFNLTPSVTPAIGKLYYNVTDSALEVQINAHVSNTIGEENYMTAVNKTGTTILDGKAVFVEGSQGNSPKARLAQADSIETSFIIGVATQDIADNARGKVTTFGKVHGFNTSAWATGTKLYLSTTDAGALTDTIPESPYITACVAITLNSTNNGTICVNPLSPLINDTAFFRNSRLIAPTQYAVRQFVENEVGLAVYMVDTLTISVYDSLGIHGDTLIAHNARLIALENTSTTANLQDVTDNGNTTTNDIFANKFEATDITDTGSPVAAFRVNRTLTTGINASGHGFRDQTIFTRPTYAYNAFDAAVTMGNATSGYYDHWAAFQARGRFDGLDSMNDAYGFVSFYTVNTGKVRKVFNADAWDVTGTGTVDLLYGYHSQRLTKGSKNFAFRSEGKAWSSFGGNGCFGCDSITTPATDAAIFSDTSTTLHMYGIGTNDFPNIKFTYERTGTDTNYASIGIDQSRMFFYTPKTYQYRFYSVGALKFNVTSTGVRVGSTTSNATAKLHLDAGTATASTAPLKFTSGTLLSTPEAGAVEFDGTHYYGTIGSTRYQLDQQGGLSGAGTANYLVKYTGATSVGNSTIQDNGSNIGLGGAPNASYKVYNNGSTFTNGITYLLGGGSGGIRSTSDIYIDALNAGGASTYLRFGNNIDRVLFLNRDSCYINATFNTRAGFAAKGNIVTANHSDNNLFLGTTNTYGEIRVYNPTTTTAYPLYLNAPSVLTGTTNDDGSGREIQNTGQIGSTDTIYTATLMREAGITSSLLKTTSNGTHAAAVAGTDYLTRSTDTIIYAVAISDMTTALTTGTSKGYFRMPHAATLVKVKASVITASSSGTPTFDINEGGTSVLGTKLTIDANETTSETAASAATITDSALANDGIITYDIDTAGTGTLAAIIYLYVIKI